MDGNIVRFADHSSITIAKLLRQTNGHGNFSMNTVILSRVLKTGYYQVGFLVSESFVKFMKRQDDVFDFLHKAIGSGANVSRVNEWLSPLSSLRDAVISTYIPTINNKITEKVDTLINGFKSWLKIVRLAGFENSSISFTNNPNKTSSPNIFDLRANNKLNGSLISSAAKFSRKLRAGFKQVGYTISITVVKFMERQDEFFQFFPTIIGTEPNYLDGQNDWVSPLSSLRNNITKSYIPQANDRIINKIEELVHNLISWFDSIKIEKIGNYSTSMASNSNEMIEQTSTVINKLLLQLNTNNRINTLSPITPVKLSEALKLV